MLAQPVLPALGRRRQEDQELKAALGWMKPDLRETRTEGDWGRGVEDAGSADEPTGDSLPKSSIPYYSLFS